MADRNNNTDTNNSTNTNGNVNASLEARIRAGFRNIRPDQAPQAVRERVEGRRGGGTDRNNNGANDSWAARNGDSKK